MAFRWRLRRLARAIRFSPGATTSTIYNSEASAYAEDRWLITNRSLIEPGLRMDWDQIVRTPLFSPRLAGTYILDDEGNTKLSAGVGIIYDTTNLGLLHQPFEGTRVDYFFNPRGQPTDANGNPASAPVAVPTTFEANRNTLEAPRYLNWSVGLEKKLPNAIFLKLEFIEKRGVRGFAYNTLNGAVDGNYFLENERDDRYDAFEISAAAPLSPVLRNFRRLHPFTGAYQSSIRFQSGYSLVEPAVAPDLIRGIRQTVSSAMACCRFSSCRFCIKWIWFIPRKSAPVCHSTPPPIRGGFILAILRERFVFRCITR